VAVAASYSIWVAHRSHGAYAFAIEPHRGWKGRVHQADPELGFAPIPDARGEHVFADGTSISMRYDEHGFRVPAVASGGGGPRRPLVLALGCSYTYGDALSAEEAFPHVLSELLDARVANAGVCSYGLASMLLRARRLVRDEPPDIVLAQYSWWLVDRAQEPFAPNRFGMLPVPYVGGGIGSRPMLVPPVFRTAIWDVPLDTYGPEPWSPARFLLFVWRVGLPLLARDDVGMTRYRVGRALGRYPRPERDRDAIVRFVYGEMDRLARDHGARFAVVRLGSDSDLPMPDWNRDLFPAEALLIDAHQPLLDDLPEPTRSAYQRAYLHWRGTPPVLVDNHPNARAHRIIAETVAASLRRAWPDVVGRQNGRPSRPPTGD
jgi:hypothetical protein